jgi:hypothetical protein
MNRRRVTTLSLLCTFVAAAGVDVGPPIGSRFPGDLRTLVGPKGAAIFLYSSTDNCPVCRSLILEIGQHREASQKLGVDIAAMSDERVVGSHPGWFVLNSKGVIVAKYFEDDPSQCYTSAAILVHRFGWAPFEATKTLEGKQVTATVGASNSTVAPGQRVALTLDIDLRPNMHVYAPGVEGYIPIDWKMEDSDTAEVHAPAFPRAEKLYLKAIDETVPAYRNHFRLTRDITIAPENKLELGVDGLGHFVAEGSLRYQACDDRVCYIPQTLRLQWTFEYHALDNQSVSPDLQRRRPAP